MPVREVGDLGEVGELMVPHVGDHVTGGLLLQPPSLLCLLLLLQGVYLSFIPKYIGTSDSDPYTDPNCLMDPDPAYSNLHFSQTFCTVLATKPGM